jgi:hypothetical protein
MGMIRGYEGMRVSDIQWFAPQYAPYGGFTYQVYLGRNGD